MSLYLKTDQVPDRRAATASPLSLLFLPALLALLTAHPSAWGASVYVVTDGYKILPDGNILEFDSKPPGELQKRNLIWDAASREVHVAGARNEVVAFQIVVQGPAEKVSLECAPLQGPSPFPSSAVSSHLLGYVMFKGAPYPDVVVPLSWKGVAPFSVPYRIAGLKPIEGQTTGVVMVEVKIPKSASSGNYSSSIHIKGGIEETLSLKLTVWDFALPSRPSILYDMNSYSSPVGTVATDQRSPYLPTPTETIRAEREFYRCANRHRAYLNIMPIHSQRGTPRYAPALSGRGKQTKCDWRHWDERFGEVLDGSAFDDGEPVPNFYLPFNLHWPWGYSHDAKLVDHRLNWRARPEYSRDHTKLIKQEYLDEWEAVASQCVAHFAEKGWDKTTYQIYFNHSNQENSNSPWRLDEPYDQWGFQVLAYYADLTHRVFRNDLGINVKYRLDIGHFYCRTPTCQCYKAKKYDLPLAKNGGGPELLEPVVDVWYIGTSHTWGNRAKVREVGRRDARKEMFAYGGGQQVLDPAPQHRSLYWYLHEFGEKGYCAWNQGCRDPEEPLRKSGGDHVWYVGKKLGFQGPVPSFRMKLWRRGSYDADYLALAEKKASRPEVMAILKKLCEYRKTHPKYKVIDFPYPNNNPNDYEVARLKLASIILGRSVAKGAKFTGRIEGPPLEAIDQITNY